MVLSLCLYVFVDDVGVRDSPCEYLMCDKHLKERTYGKNARTCCNDYMRMYTWSVIVS